MVQCGKVVLVSLLWLGFLAGWWRVAARTPTREIVHSVASLGLLTSVYGALLAGWIYHNIRIYRRKGPRRSPRLLSPDLTRDGLGRRFRQETDILRQQHIEIRLQGETKVLQAATPQASVPGAELTSAEEAAR